MSTKEQELATLTAKARAAREGLDEANAELARAVGLKVAPSHGVSIDWRSTGFTIVHREGASTMKFHANAEGVRSTHGNEVARSVPYEVAANMQIVWKGVTGSR